jgi:hypothetical protein
MPQAPHAGLGQRRIADRLAIFLIEVLVVEVLFIGLDLEVRRGRVSVNRPIGRTRIGAVNGDYPARSG